VPHLHRTISYIKSRGVKAGAVINPSTPVAALEEIARDLDFVLVMSVNPGIGG
jgi:ribulose-phosphate 3-epimerase